jgi:UDP-N-acetylglucosamine:LPS N-acetylglucosamine transferase
MRAADCILSKAGGLTVSEALVCGLPLILVDIIPGQETGNANHVVYGNAGVLLETRSKSSKPCAIGWKMIGPFLPAG